MDSGVKQRVIGACVLAAVGVLFLPTLLERPKEQVIDTETHIPTKPEFTLYTHDEPEKPADTAPPPSQEQLFLPEEGYEPDDQDSGVPTAPAESAAASNKPEETVGDEDQPGLSSAGLPKSWVVQVASFTDQDRADKMTATLLEGEFRAYTRQVMHLGKPVYRVYVGPSIDRDDALKLKAKLDAKLNADTLVMRLSP